MDVAFFSTKPYEQAVFELDNTDHTIHYFEPHLTKDTAKLADAHQAVCVFVNDTVDKSTLEKLASLGVKFIALRCAGFNNVDLQAAQTLGLKVVRVPAYSPAAVAEHAIALMMDLNRQIHRAHNRVREGNFSLNGLMGFDMKGKTVGVVGTGKIGQSIIPILKGFGCQVLAYDVYPNQEAKQLGAEYVEQAELFKRSDIISFHCPLVPQTHHLVNPDTIQQMKPGVMLINTSRGGLIDTKALIEGLKSRQIGSVGLDVYEEEDNLFFEDLSNTVIADDVFSRLLTFPNVLITGHQAFLTREALGNIAETTLSNLTQLEKSESCPNIVEA